MKQERTNGRTDMPQLRSEPGFTLVELMVSLGIFSVVWRWNDFLWPLVALSRKDLYTLQVGLSAYSGELNVQWHYVLAMTMVSMAPMVLIFAFLQRFITTGIASTGLK